MSTTESIVVGFYFENCMSDWHSYNSTTFRGHVVNCNPQPLLMRGLLRVLRPVCSRWSLRK